MNEAGKRIGLRINRKKTQFMKNAYCEDGGVQHESSQIVETLPYVYLGRSMNMENLKKTGLEGRTEQKKEQLVVLKRHEERCSYVSGNGRRARKRLEPRWNHRELQQMMVLARVPLDPNCYAPSHRFESSL
ncbi:hypothetical protein RB195_022011 [Necator americanus]|uniref:Reverse transcriptase domain-containing protein n=1 Tax=Necator americanus TaxID=51031 RepID=A0ABR1EDX2_NECAM